MDTFYVGVSSEGAKYLFSRRLGKIVRQIPADEWAFLRAIESTAGGIPLDWVPISAWWLDKALALGK